MPKKLAIGNISNILAIFQSFWQYFKNLDNISKIMATYTVNLTIFWSVIVTFYDTGVYSTNGASNSAGSGQ